jgi:DNA (cytosine-5)-methyltransferase 1
VRYAPEHESDSTGSALRYHDLGSASAYVRSINYHRSSSLLYNHKSRYNNERDIEIFSLLKEGENSTAPAIAHLMPYRRRSAIFKDKYFRLRGGEVCRSITAHMRYDCNMYIHPSQPRGLTAREAARVQGFPDDYAFSGTFQRIYQQIGNAVPPPLAKVVGQALIDATT